MSGTCLLIIDDGREDYLDRCLESCSIYLPPMDACVMVSDPDHELGFAGAVQAGWDGVLETGCEWVFWLESDFIFTAPVPLPLMRRTLEAMPALVQMALKRQAWNEEEKAAGGIVELHPEDFAHKSGGYGAQWTEHRRCYTTNPHLCRTSLLELGWPRVPNSEGIFTHQLLDRGQHFAYWGAPLDPPRCWHIGETRKGTGY